MEKLTNKEFIKRSSTIASTAEIFLSIQIKITAGIGKNDNNAINKQFYTSLSMIYYSLMMQFIDILSYEIPKEHEKWFLKNVCEKVEDFSIAIASLTKKDAQKSIAQTIRKLSSCCELGKNQEYINVSIAKITTG